tara:strand:+ start:288 stop:764 length:477 start_codon:yes stop_codon:yes gene_type:complete
MVDLTKYGHDLDVDSVSEGGGGSKLTPGRYNMTFCGDEIITGANGWEALKLYFEIEDTTINMNYACTMAHDSSDKAVSIGIETLRKIGKACGVTGALTDPSVQLLGKSLSAELVEGEKGYMEIKDDFGNTFQPVMKQEPKTSEASKIVEATSKDDVPF